MINITDSYRSDVHNSVIMEGGFDRWPNSVEFSPDSKLLYLCTDTQHRVDRMHLFQYDMQYIEDSALFVNSEILIASGNNGWTCN